MRRAFQTGSTQFPSNRMHIPVFCALLLGGGPVAPCTAVEAEAVGSVVEKVHFFGPLNGFRLV